MADSRIQATSNTEDVQHSSRLEMLFYTLKRPVRFPVLYSYFLIVVCYLQVLLIMACIPLKFFVNVPVDNTVINIFRYAGPIELKFDTSNSFQDVEIGLIVIYVYEIFVACLLGGVFFAIIVKKRTPGRTLIKVLRAVLMIHYYVFSFAIHSFLIYAIKYVLNGDVSLSVLGKLPFTVLAGLGIGFNVLYALFGGFSYSQIRNKDFFAKRNSSICDLTFIYKLVSTLLVVLISRGSGGKWTLVMIAIAYMALVSIIFQEYLIFYNLKMVKLFCLIEANLWACGLVLFGLAIWDETKTISIQTTFFVFWALVLPCAAYQARSRFQNLLLASLKRKTSHIKHDAHYFKKILAIKWIFLEGSKFNWKSTKRETNRFQVPLFGFINEHIEKCVDTNCPCRKIFIENVHTGKRNLEKPDEINVNKVYMNDLLHLMIGNVIKEAAMYSKNRDSILLDMAYFFLVKDDKFLLSYATYRQLKAKKSDGFMIQKNTSMKILEKMIEGIVKSKSGLIQDQGQQDKLRISQLIHHNELTQQLKVLIAQQTQKQLDLWDLFALTSWNSKHLFKVSREIENTRFQIDKIWTEVSSQSHNDLVVYLLYGLYSSIINNSFIKSEKLMKRVDIMNTLSMNNSDAALTNETIYDAANIIVKMAMDRERLGKMDHCSKNATEYFGYPQQELKGSNVAILMPKFFRKRHQKFLTQYLHSRKERIFNTQQIRFGCSKKGYALPINLYISTYPSLQEGLYYFGIMRPVKDFKQYILISNNGHIDCCTEEVATELGIEAHKRKIHISELCSELGKVNGAFTYLFLQQQNENLQTAGPVLTTKKTKFESDVMDFEDDMNNISITKGDMAPLFEKYDKSLSFLVDPNKQTVALPTAPFETQAGLETTFRANTVGNTLPNQPGKAVPALTLSTMNPATTILKKLLQVDPNNNKKIYEKFTTEGEILEFTNLKDKSQVLYYHCTIQEQVYGDSVLRILTLSQEYRRSKFDEMLFEQVTDDRPLFPFPSNDQGGLSVSVADRDPFAEMREEKIGENEVDSFMDDAEDIPHERMDPKSLRSRRSNDKSRDDMMYKKVAYEGNSVTSRFRFDPNSVTSRGNLPAAAGGNSATSRIQDSQLFLFGQAPQDRVKLLNDNNSKDKRRESAPLQLHSNSFTRGQTALNSRFETMPIGFGDVTGSHDFGGSNVFSNRKSQPPVNTSGSHKPSQSPALLNTDPIKKFLKQHRTHIRKDYENASTGSKTSSASSNRIYSQVERAFGEWKKIDKYASWLCIASAVFIAIFAVMISYFVIIKIELNGIDSDSQALFYIGNRINSFLEVNRNSIILDLYLSGYIDEARHVQDGIPNYIEYVLESLQENVQSLNDENAEILAFVDDLSSDLQQKLYSDKNEIQEVNESNAEIKSLILNTFDAITKIVSFGTEIYVTAVADLSKKQDQITNIIENSFGGLMTSLKTPYDIYTGKIDDDFNVIDMYFIAAIAITIAGFAVVFFKSYSVLMQLSRDTNKFWEALIRFELEKAEEHKTELRILLKGFQQDLSFNELFAEVNKLKEGEYDTVIQTKTSNKTDKSKNGRHGFLKKSHDWRLSQTFLPTFIPLVISFILFLITLSISRIFIALQQSDENEFIDELESVYNTFQLQSYTSTILYQYIRTKADATVQDEPIDTVLLANLDSMSNVNSLIVQFQNDKNEKIASMISEDLCTTIFSALNSTLCYEIGDGANTKGLTGIVSYLQNAFSDIKSSFDSNINDANIQTTTLATDSMKDIEMEFEYLRKGFDTVGVYLEEHETDNQSKFMNLFTGVIVAITIIESVVFLWLLNKGYWSLRKHKENHALLLKNIPISLIWENKLIRNYIFTLFKGTVQSVKYG